MSPKFKLNNRRDIWPTRYLSLLIILLVLAVTIYYNLPDQSKPKPRHSKIDTIRISPGKKITGITMSGDSVVEVSTRAKLAGEIIDTLTVSKKLIQNYSDHPPLVEYSTSAVICEMP